MGNNYLCGFPEKAFSKVRRGDTIIGFQEIQANKNNGRGGSSC